MSIEKMHEEFEAWLAAGYPKISRQETSQDCLFRMIAIQAWQASRETLVIELPRDVTNVTCKDFEAGRDAVIDAIEAAGVRVKS